MRGLQWRMFVHQKWRPPSFFFCADAQQRKIHVRASLEISKHEIFPTISWVIHFQSFEMQEIDPRNSRLLKQFCCHLIHIFLLMKTLEHYRTHFSIFNEAHIEHLNQKLHFLTWITSLRNSVQFSPFFLETHEWMLLLCIRSYALGLESTQAFLKVKRIMHMNFHCIASHFCVLLLPKSPRWMEYLHIKRSGRSNFRLFFGVSVFCT